jgi:cell division protein FtsL
MKYFVIAMWRAFISNTPLGHVIIEYGWILFVFLIVVIVISVIISVIAELNKKYNAREEDKIAKESLSASSDKEDTKVSGVSDKQDLTEKQQTNPVSNLTEIDKGLAIETTSNLTEKQKANSIQQASNSTEKQKTNLSPIKKITTGKLNKLILPITIIIASLILGAFFYAAQVNQQQSIERQKQMELQAKLEQAKIEQQKMEQQARIEQAKLEQAKIEQQKMEQSNKIYTDRRKADCFTIYKIESNKNYNVKSWYYDPTNDTCKIEYINFINGQSFSFYRTF